MAVPIFVIDSNPAVRRLVEQISTPEGFEVIGFQDGPAALEAARHATPALIIVDYNLDNMTFSGFCREINQLDHLAETHLVTLVNSSDHPGEAHLRSLGVRASLEKPVQSHDLLAIINSLPQLPRTTNGVAIKQRPWPPAASLTDSDQAFDLPNHPPDVPDRQEGHAMNQHETIQTSISAASRAAAPLEAMKDLLDQLLLAVVRETESRLAERLPRMIEEGITSRIRPILQKELRAQLADVLTTEQLTAIISPLVLRDLPTLLDKEMRNAEPAIRHAASEATQAAVGEKLNQWITTEAKTVIKHHVADIIRAEIGAVDQMVKDEIRAAAQQVSDIVRASAEQTIERAVQQVVPDLAEQHIRAELKRLTAPD